MKIAASIVVAIAIALATGELVQRRGWEPVPYEGVEPGLSYTTVVVGGWPFPFLYDKPGLSVANRVSLTGALTREDEFRFLPFAGNVAIYAGLIYAAWLILRRVRRAR